MQQELQQIKLDNINKTLNNYDAKLRQTVNLHIPRIEEIQNFAADFQTRETTDELQQLEKLKQLKKKKKFFIKIYLIRVIKHIIININILVKITRIIINEESVSQRTSNSNEKTINIRATPVPGNSYTNDSSIRFLQVSNGLHMNSEQLLQKE
ncbi:24613_t:CDS:2 [Cetraspora pellucida]|uniref:24613_t:CDS:1 n=1 Tax=Cetraspora pellucida TaxID=1433469 RepID=A0A9N9JWW2_9GLOM|nr:24613_t:CDS:2 [Cetraspora pellucida]